MMIRPPDDDAIADAVRRLRAGELVGIPTETVYGLGADAENVHAVAKIFALKGRPATHPVIVHLFSPDEIDQWARDVSADAQRLLRAFAPGPLTLIVKRSARVPDVVTGGQDTVGLRFPSHPVARALLRDFGGGVAAPSANRFGRISATTAQHVADEFAGGSVDGLRLILDGGPCAVGIESTIVDVSRSRAAVLRPGGIAATDLAAVLGYMPEARSHASPRVSGDLASHYAPQTPTRLVAPDVLADEALALGPTKAKRAVLARSATPPAGFQGLWRFAPAAAADYARALYAELRVLDASAADLILIEAPPSTSEWQAINDRLRRATHKAEVTTGDRR